MILVSSCLAGIECRYDGTHRLKEKIRSLVEEKKAVTVCPELLGGFSTPRQSAEIVGGTGKDVLAGDAKVIEKSGRDVTDLYVKGAYKTLEIALKLQVTHVVLKQFSPSCGSKSIYNGTFSGERIQGEGVTSALLRKAGITVLSEEDLYYL
ncbi:DUF523 domain-containing protein [Priestia filamentosa]|uniref:DUF523 domain-containing protein n=1 Tax=Priestia filamentosa TaxID=1402861 RepID=UPI001FB22B01|nr:DUF523 domain-containing protein [Priestia filamentosa]MED3729206.1 DUF523 domain-containing protein [Priestia filamentosa]UOE63167.1 DUF523 domain-containing protein [Priestia filamentosa]